MVNDFKRTIFKTSENDDYSKTTQLTSKVKILHSIILWILRFNPSLVIVSFVFFNMFVSKI